MKIDAPKFNKYFRIFIWVFVIAACLPFLRAASLTVFRADDFSYARNYMADRPPILQFAFKSTVDVWKSWQGAYASSFLIYLTNPLYRYSYRLLRIMILFLVVMAITGLYVFVDTVKKHFSVEVDSIYVFALILIPLLSFREYYDIYLWYTGAMAYLLPVIGAEFGISALLKWTETGNTAAYILSIFFLILMCGCVLEMTGFGMWVLLIIILADGIKSKKINRGLIAAFLIALFAALLNAIAPGNFVRHDVIDSVKLNIPRAVFYTIKATVQELIWLHSNLSFFSFELLAFILGMNIKGKAVKPDKSLLWLIAGALIILPVITAFPVILGYSSQGNSMPNRCLFLFDASLIISCITAFIYAGIMVEHKGVLEERTEIIMAKLCPLIIAIYILIPSITNNGGRSTWATVADHILDGKVIMNNAYYREMYDYIRDSEDTDVIIDYLPKETAGCTRIDISEDKEYFANLHIAKYFGKENVIYKPRA